MKKISIKKSEEIYKLLYDYNLEQYKKEMTKISEKQPAIFGLTAFLGEKFKEPQASFYCYFLVCFIIECYDSYDVEIPQINQKNLITMVKKWNFILSKKTKELKELEKNFKETKNNIEQTYIAETFIKYLSALQPDKKVPFLSDEQRKSMLQHGMSIINLMDNEMAKLLK